MLNNYSIYLIVSGTLPIIYGIWLSILNLLKSYFPTLSKPTFAIYLTISTYCWYIVFWLKSIFLFSILNWLSIISMFLFNPGLFLYKLNHYKSNFSPCSINFALLNKPMLFDYMNFLKFTHSFTRLSPYPNNKLFYFARSVFNNESTKLFTSSKQKSFFKWNYLLSWLLLII